MRSDYREPLNLGQDRLVTINELAADHRPTSPDVEVALKHVPGPQGVRGRNSDNTRLREVLGWEPPISLEDGLGTTYGWIEEQVRAGMEQGYLVSRADWPSGGRVVSEAYRRRQTRFR